MKITFPNILSISRLVISIFFVVLFISNDLILQFIALILFILGSITDYFDGYIARKYNLTSDLGKFLDPLADKFFTISAFFSFVLLNIIPLWMLLILIGRDLILTILRTININLITTSFEAKLKTTLQMIFIIITIIMVLIINSFPNSMLSTYFNLFLYSIYYDLIMFFIVILTIWSFLKYIIKTFK